MKKHYLIMNALRVFNHKIFGEVWTMTNEQGETFFVAKDVAVALGYSKPRNALAIHVDDDDKTTALIQGPGSNYKLNEIFKILLAHFVQYRHSLQDA